jgi:transposase
LYRELTMIEVREVLRRFGAGHSKRRIGRDTGMGRNTVDRYLAAAEERGFETGGGEPSAELVAAVMHAVQDRPAPVPSEQRVALHAHRAQIETWLHDGELKLSKVHVLLQRQGTETSYATLRRYVMDEFGFGLRTPTVRVDDPAPGQEAQIDYGMMGLMRDPETGRTRKLWALVVTLSHSRHEFVYPTFSQDLSQVCAGLDAAWKFFGGMPARIVPDNMKTVVVAASATAPRLNDAFTDYAQARGLFVDPARVRKPRDKPRVENQVACVRESWFQGEQFLSLEHARRSAETWCRDVAGRRIHGTTRRAPLEHYEEVERVHMLPAPSESFDVPLWTEAKVHVDHHIQVQRALYSVPTRFIGRRVRVRADRTLVQVFVGAELIKVHPRKQPGERSTDVNDYPPGKSEYALRNIDRFVQNAEKHGENVGIYTQRLLAGALPWTRMRQAHQLERLCRKYGAARVDALCRQSLDFDVIDVPRVERMLKLAINAEHSAEDEGRLRALPRGRFTRDESQFQTRGTGGQ